MKVPLISAGKTRLRRAMSALAVCAILLPSVKSSAVGTWYSLSNPAPEAIGTMLLLPDGTVMAQYAGISSGWVRLTPDSTGGYTNGTWSYLTVMQNTRLYYSSQVMPNGQVFVAGGEYGTGKTNAEIFDPVADTWTAAPTTPAAVGFVDSISETLPNGNVLVAPVNPSTPGGTLIWNMSSANWSTGPAVVRYNQSEANWVKLPYESILTVDALDAGSAPGTTSDRFIPSLDEWITDANLPVQLWANLCGSPACFVGEAGPAFLLPNGNAFFMGGTGSTAIYTPVPPPSSNTWANGSWVAGAAIPGGLTAADTPGAMMANGKVLCVANPAPYLNGGTNVVFPTPTSFYEYDYSTGNGGTFTQVNAPGGGTTDNVVGFNCRMLDLPDGTVLFTDGNSATIYVYKPSGSPLAAGQPSIHNVAWNTDGTLTITGTQLTGISEGASYGDDAQMNSNYPIIRFTDPSGNVFYGRSSYWSTTDVQTGSQLVSTLCALPAGVLNEHGTLFSMQVVVNGIPSNPVAFYSPIWVNFSYAGATQNGSFANPYSTLPPAVSVSSAGGTIAINASTQPSLGHVSVPYTISRVVNIVSVYGPSTVSN